MEEEKEPVVVYTTGNYAHAALMKSLLESSGIMCLMLDAATNTTAGCSGAIAAMDIRLIVPYTQAEQARSIIAETAKDIPAPNGNSTLICPNCGHKFAVPSEEWSKCPDCGYEIGFIGQDEAPPAVAEIFMDAKTFCSGCLSPSVLFGGKCPSCSGELKILSGGAKLCPARLHVLPADKVKDTEIICPACKKIWIVE